MTSLNDRLSDRIDEIIASHFGDPPFGTDLEGTACSIANLMLDGKLVVVTAARLPHGLTSLSVGWKEKV